jgi:hypothetical protein
LFLKTDGAGNLSFSSDLPTTSFTGATVETSIAGGDLVLIYDDSATAVRKMTRTNFVAGIGATAGQVIQVVDARTSTYASSATTIPIDDTIPQNTEGFEIITASITPSSASNKLIIIPSIFATSSTAGAIIVCALFQDSTASALTAKAVTAGAGGWMIMNTYIHFMTAGTTSATTFKIRAGGHVGTTYVNGNTTTRMLGGVENCSLTILEVKV